MDLSARKGLFACFAFASIGLAACQGWRYGRAVRHSAGNEAGGTLWLCTNDRCAAEFIIAAGELAAHYRAHPGQPPLCPQCGDGNTIRAQRCSACGAFYPRSPAEGADAGCPRCKTASSP